MDDYGRRLTVLVADQIQALRQAQGLSLDELGARAGLHATSVGLVVRGKRGLTLAAASALCRALGVTLSSLVVEAERLLLEQQKSRKR